MLSNAEHSFRSADTARRFFAPTVSTARMQDHAYFEALQAELDNGGYEALLYHLLHEVDLAGFNVRKVPQTTALRQQRDRSLPPLKLGGPSCWRAARFGGRTRDFRKLRSPTATRARSRSEIESRFGVGKNTQVRTFNQQGAVRPGAHHRTATAQLHQRSQTRSVPERDGLRQQQEGAAPDGLVVPAADKVPGRLGKAYPGWVWRNPQITEWQAEAHDFKDAEVVDLEEAEAKAAAEDATMREAIRAMKERQDAKDAAKAAADQATIDGIMDGYETDLAKREQDFIGPRKPAQGKRPWQR